MTIDEVAREIGMTVDAIRGRLRRRAAGIPPPIAKQYVKIVSQKNQRCSKYLIKMAERQGFEPWEGLPSLVFKTSAKHIACHCFILQSINFK